MPNMLVGWAQSHTSVNRLYILFIGVVAGFLFMKIGIFVNKGAFAIIESHQQTPAVHQQFRSLSRQGLEGPMEQDSGTQQSVGVKDTVRGIGGAIWESTFTLGGDWGGMRTGNWLRSAAGRFRRRQNPVSGERFQHRMSAAMLAADEPGMPLDAGLPVQEPGQRTPDFDWEAYIAYYPELLREGVNTEERALKHYKKRGVREGRLKTRVRAVLRYTACNGLINQLYCHITALALASTMGMTVVLPAAGQRSSFGHYYNLNKTKNEVVWSSAPMEGLFDVDYIINFWQQKGVTIVKGPTYQHFPDASKPNTAFQEYPVLGVSPDAYIQIPGTFTRATEMEELVDVVRAALLERAAIVLRADPHAAFSAVVIDMPCLLFTIRTQRVLPLVSTAAKSLRFATDMVRLANTVRTGMARKHGAASYTGLHLRFEKDAVDWIRLLGGEQAVWDRYVFAMRSTGGFSDSVSVYVACGMLSYNDNSGFKKHSRRLVRSGMASRVLHKEMFLSKRELAMLTSEQHALIDFLVLVGSSHFVGIRSSTFSFYLQEYRAFLGMDPHTVGLLDTAAIGTDPLFDATARIFTAPTQ